MNDQELDDLLGALRADTPAMTDAAFAANRARLSSVSTAGTEESAPATRPAERAVERLLVPYQPAAPPVRGRSVRRAAPWLVAAAVLGVVGVGVALTAMPDGTPQVSPAAPTSSTAAPAAASTTPVPELQRDEVAPLVPGSPEQRLPAMPAQPVNDAGALAANVADLPVGPGQYLYSRTVRRQPARAGNPAGEMVAEVWVPRDRWNDWMRRHTAVAGQVQGGPDPASGGVEELTATGGNFDRVPAGVTRIGENGQAVADTVYRWGATQAAIAELPTDPVQLYALLDADSGSTVHQTAGPAAVAVKKLVDLLAGPSAVAIPADVQAAVYRTLGYLPGLVVRQGVSTFDGRSAVSLGYDEGSTRIEVLVDPATGRVVGSRYSTNGTTYGQTAVTVAVAPGIGVSP